MSEETITTVETTTTEAEPENVNQDVTVVVASPPVEDNTVWQTSIMTMLSDMKTTVETLSEKVTSLEQKNTEAPILLEPITEQPELVTETEVENDAEDLPEVETGQVNMSRSPCRSLF